MRWPWQKRDAEPREFRIPAGIKLDLGRVGEEQCRLLAEVSDWFARKLKEELRPGEHVYPCPNPECLSTRPQFTVALLESHVERNGVLVSVVTGRRVSCQACGLTFSIDATGPFKQHPGALPPTPIYSPPKVNSTTESLGDDVARQIKERGERARAPDWRQRPTTP